MDSKENLTNNEQNLAVIVGKNIANLRKQKNMSQIELANLLDMGAESLSRIEKGNVVPRLPRLQAIAMNLDCQVSELFRSKHASPCSKAERIIDLLKPLPNDVQEDLVNMMANLAINIKKTLDIK